MITAHQFQKKGFNLRKIWQLRYRFYAFVSLLILAPVLFASNSDINPNIDFSIDNFETLNSNFLYSSMHKVRKSKQAEPIAGTTEKLAQNNLPPVDTQGEAIPKTEEKELEEQKPVESKVAGPVSLNQLVPRPANPQYTNFIRYPKYNINTPLLFSTVDDLYQTNADGSIKMNLRWYS